jgi:hypothetical protein
MKPPVAIQSGLTPGMIREEAKEVAKKRYIKNVITLYGSDKATTITTEELNLGADDLLSRKDLHHSIFSQAKRNLERRVLGIYESRRKK